MEQGDDSCANQCSAEPEGPAWAGLPGLINFGMQAQQNIKKVFSHPDVSVYMNYRIDPHGNVTVPSLTINNQSGYDVSVMNVNFAVTNPTQTYSYPVSQEEMYVPVNYIPGVRVGGNHQSNIDVDLTPSGDFLYPGNTFKPWDMVQISVQFANSFTGQYYSGINYSFGPFSIGLGK